MLYAVSLFAHHHRPPCVLRFHHHALFIPSIVTDGHILCSEKREGYDFHKEAGDFAAEHIMCFPIFNFTFFFICQLSLMMEGGTTAYLLGIGTSYVRPTSAEKYGNSPIP